jgi:hypothetical protein
MDSRKKAKKRALNRLPKDSPTVMEVLVSWDIDVFCDNIEGLSDNTPIEERALACAKYACNKYFKDDGWVLKITVGSGSTGRCFIVDTMTNKVEEVKGDKARRTP